MFITSEKRIGTCYFEFCFCKNENPINLNKRFNKIDNWQNDSLLISDEDINEFYRLYGKIFECALFPNGKKGFFAYGINYYDKNTSEKVLYELKQNIDKKYLNLVDWLEIAVEKYNGFYILGI